jgi:hypothetical protein
LVPEGLAGEYSKHDGGFFLGRPKQQIGETTTDVYSLRSRTTVAEEERHRAKEDELFEKVEEQKLKEHSHGIQRKNLRGRLGREAG